MAWPPPLPSQILATDVTTQTTRHADDHNRIAAITAVVVPATWQYVNPSGGAATAFVSPWVNYGAGLQVARFRREAGDTCRLEGFVAGGANGSTIFNLPLGFRPPAMVRFASCTDASVIGVAQLDIYPTGVVTFHFITAMTGNVAAMSLCCSWVIDPASL